MVERRAPSSVRQHLRAWAPWVVAAIILVYVLTKIPLQAVGEALTGVSLPRFAVLVVALVGGPVVADALAIWLALRAVAVEHSLPYRTVLVMRGAASLLSLVNYAAAQGGIVYFARARNQVPVAVMTGAVVLASSAFVAVLAVVVGIGLMAGAVPDHPELRVVAWAALAVLPLYLLVLMLRPRVLTRLGPLRYLFHVEFGKAAAVLGARALHLSLLIAGHWLIMGLFGITVPLAVALCALPALFLVAVLPIAPAGLGTTQAAALTLFGSYAAGATETTRQAEVLAYSLSSHAAGAALLMAIGLFCLRRMGIRRQTSV